MDCAGCHKKIPDKAKFCPYCGVALVVKSECGKSSSPVKWAVGGIVLVILLAVAGFFIVKPILEKRAAAHYHSEAVRIFHELGTVDDSIFLNSILIIGDYESNITSRKRDPFSEVERRRFRVYRAAQRYVNRRILAVAPEYTVKTSGADSPVVNADIYIRVMRLCGAKGYQFKGQ